ncbi:SPO22-domain-containing protein [Exidia glandulosa HHB12029]|uniref:SPO22-domain-containing protein n=1 Tax=Exidia glandulosa HHB12029 TaxID=1314781 RepID=A0A165C430_EXIGL|nr:SPO22-domain-containing protein [Exidia glandulosa HHB12029]
MAAHEQRSQLFDDLSDLLLRVKPRLQDGGTGTVLHDLERIGTLAVQLAKLRPKAAAKANRAWQTTADALDREGVYLWNASSLLRTSGRETVTASLLAALRLAAFRLIVAGLETNPAAEVLVRVLNNASKTAAALTDAERTEDATDVLGAAAQYEEQLRQIDDPDGVHAQEKASATVEYLSARMLAAWRQGNEGVSYFMLQKITESDEDRLARLVPRDRQLLAARVLEIGRSVLRKPTGSGATADGKHAQEAVQWLQKAFALVEKIEELPDVPELKRSILRSLSKAYYTAAAFDPENLTRAEVALQELIVSVDACEDVQQNEYQELRWMRLSLMRRKQAPDHTILEGFRSAIAHLPWTESSVADVLQELRAMSNQSKLVTDITQAFLVRALSSGLDGAGGHEFVDRILLSLIFHCAKDSEHTRAVQELEGAFGAMANQENFALGKVPTMACQSLLWQFGDRLYGGRKYSQAADWFVLAAHPAFRSMAAANNAKCFRKAALCHIQNREYAQAAAIIRRCPGSEAATYYVAFIAAAHQGLEDEAVRAVREMVKAPGYDRQMLLLATQLAHERDLKPLLVAVLEALLADVRAQKGVDNEIEAVTLIRCIIRLLMELLSQPGAQMYGPLPLGCVPLAPLPCAQHLHFGRRQLVEALVGHFDTARTLIEAASVKKASALIAKDIAWLWRASYNCAVQGCADWPECELLIADLFDLARALMEQDCKASIADPDVEIHFHMLSASFAAITGRVFDARKRDTADANYVVAQRRIVKDISTFKALMQELGPGIDRQRDDLREKKAAMMHLAVVYEVEGLVALRDWDPLLACIETTASLPSTDKLRTYDAIADILWPLTDCPANVQYAALEAVLRASLDAGTLSIPKFARWLRAICTAYVGRERDRARVLGYIDQAVEVMRDDADDEYPADERQWLLATAYNTGLQCHSASHLDDSKKWFECAIRLCKFVPNGDARAQKVCLSIRPLLRVLKRMRGKISDTYRQLLERYRRQGQGGS